MSFLYVLRDILIAILRLLMLQLVFFTSGLHQILFNKVEISNISLVLIPQRRERDKLSFVDDLYINNIDLASNKVLPPSNCNFQEDDEDDGDDGYGETHGGK